MAVASLTNTSTCKPHTVFHIPLFHTMKLLKALLVIGLFVLMIFHAAAGHLATALFTLTAGSLVTFGWHLNANQQSHAFVNSLNNLIPDIYAALDVVSRELVGLIPSVQRDPRADRCALGATMRSFATRPNTAAGDVTAAMALPSAAFQTVDNKTFQITKSRFTPFSWTGEEQRSMDTGPGYLTIQQDQIAQAIRELVNEVETDIATAAYLGASRAYGTAGTTAFGTNVGESAQIRKILDDNGAPGSGRSLIGDTTMGANLRTLSQLTKVNESGTNMTLRDGEILNLNGLSVKESAQIVTPSVGTAASATTNTTGYAKGLTTITLAATGTGTIVAGDIITINGDINKYVVATGIADVSAGGTIVLNAPGLRQAIPASAKAITVIAAGARNVAFSTNAILLGTRLPALPQEGDMAIMREIITDPRSGLTFELAVYPGYRMVTYQLLLAWGVASIKPEHSAILLG